MAGIRPGVATTATPGPDAPTLTQRPAITMAAGPRGRFERRACPAPIRPALGGTDVKRRSEKPQATVAGSATARALIARSGVWEGLKSPDRFLSEPP